MQIKIKSKKQTVILNIKNGDVSIKIKKVKKDKCETGLNASAPSALDTLKEMSEVLDKDGIFTLLDNEKAATAPCNITKRINDHFSNLLKGNSEIKPVFINTDVFNYNLYNDDTKQKLDALVKYLLDIPSSISDFDLVAVNQKVTKHAALSFNIHIDVIESKGFYDWVYDETNRVYKETKERVSIKSNLAIEKLFNMAAQSKEVTINREVFSYDLSSSETKEKLDKVIKELLTLPIAKLGYDAINVSLTTIKGVASGFGIDHKLIESEGFYEWCHAELNRQYAQVKDKLRYSIVGESNKPAPSSQATRTVCTDFGIKDTFHNQLEALMKDVIDQYPHIQKNYPDQFNMVVDSMATKYQLNKHFLATKEFKEWFNTRLVQEIKLNNL